MELGWSRVMLVWLHLSSQEVEPVGMEVGPGVGPARL